MDKERERRPNWVKARSECTIFGTFNKIAATIEHDVACFNDLPKDERSHREYYVKRTHYLLEVTGNFDPRANIRVKLNDDCVEIQRDRVTTFKVCQKWNEDDLVCDLTIDGEPTCLWKISQKAVGDFMFNGMVS